jgi:hypothetical protein
MYVRDCFSFSVTPQSLTCLEACTHLTLVANSVLELRRGGLSIQRTSIHTPYPYDAGIEGDQDGLFLTF